MQRQMPGSHWQRYTPRVTMSTTAVMHLCRWYFTLFLRCIFLLFSYHLSWRRPHDEPEKELSLFFEIGPIEKFHGISLLSLQLGASDHGFCPVNTAIKRDADRRRMLKKQAHQETISCTEIRDNLLRQADPIVVPARSKATALPDVITSSW